MTWKPNLEDVPLPLAVNKLLKKAVWKLYQPGIISNPLEVLRDEYGTYGYRYTQFILVAKEKPYGNIVSVHKYAVFRAMEHEIRIMMWLDSAKAYYTINPYKIFETGEINHRGKSAMLNFSIKLLESCEIKK